MNNTIAERVKEYFGNSDTIQTNVKMICEFVEHLKEPTINNSIADLITDEEIEYAWGNANFGEPKRKVIADTLRQYAKGYPSGKTAMMICNELGLAAGENVTDKGYEYLLAAEFSDPKELQQEPKGLRWVKCSADNLPTDGQDLLFYSPAYNSIHQGSFNTKDYFDRANMFVSTEGGHFSLSKVTHWIPLPPAPSEEADQNIKL